MWRHVVATTLFLGCVSSRSSLVPSPSCWPGSSSGDTIRIALADSIDSSRLSIPRNESEQLVGRQVRDRPCGGTIAPIAHGVTVARPGRAVLALTWGTADARDLLDRGFDAVLTGDPRVLEYAAARADFEVRPLEWSRTYVIVFKHGAGPTWAEGPSVWRDAIPGDARPAQPPFWWRSARCEDRPVVSDSAAPPRPARMVYPAGDAAARGLAERFVARGASLEPPDHRERIVPLGALALGEAVAVGQDYAVVPIPRATSDACGTLAALGIWRRVPTEVIAMLDTRLHLVIRRGRFGVVDTGDGVPLFDP